MDEELFQVGEAIRKMEITPDLGAHSFELIGKIIESFVKGGEIYTSSHGFFFRQIRKINNPNFQTAVLYAQRDLIRSCEIVCIGDGNTQLADSTETSMKLRKTYPFHLLEEIIGGGYMPNILNAGIPNATAGTYPNAKPNEGCYLDNIKNESPFFYFDNKKRLFLLNLGANDVVSTCRADFEPIRKGFEELTKALNIGYPVYVIGIYIPEPCKLNLGSDELSRLNEGLEKMCCQKKGWDFIHPPQFQERHYQDDRHLNQEGHNLLAKVVYDRIKPNLIIP